jgi:UDP-N-acetylglucosamine 2-epimerase (non-hydrolysing)
MNALAGRPGLRARLIHTGQHYDAELSQSFFEDLAIPSPDCHLGVGSGTHAEQTARIMESYEAVVTSDQPDLVLVVGDVNSTLACSLVAAKACTAVAHVEAGLRSFDRTMPEEINRVVTDLLADYLFTSCPEAETNLRREGIAPEKILFVGNVMIDTLLESLPLAAKKETAARFNLTGRPYAVATIHRPSNVDERDGLQGVLTILESLGQMLPVIFPVHPRTERRAERLHLAERLRGCPGLQLTPPLRYLEFLDLLQGARLVLTDSGGIQEETTVLGVPCLTLRPNTERPITIEMGTNLLVGTDPRRVIAAARQALADGPPTDVQRPPLWDGRAAVRIAEHLERIASQRSGAARSHA